RLRSIRNAVPRPDHARARDPRSGRPRVVESADRRAARPLDQDGSQPRVERVHEDPGRRSGAGDRQGPRGGHRRPAVSATTATIEARERVSTLAGDLVGIRVRAITVSGGALLLLALALTVLVAVNDVPSAGHAGTLKLLTRLAA